MKYIVYVLQSNAGGFYTGSTRNLHERLKRHRKKRGAKFTKGKGVMQLVYFEEYLTRAAAMKREKQIKGYSRKKKSKLVSLHLRSRLVKI
jgi:putative endonuclease